MPPLDGASMLKPIWICALLFELIQAPVGQLATTDFNTVAELLSPCEIENAVAPLLTGTFAEFAVAMTFSYRVAPQCKAPPPLGHWTVKLSA